MRHQPLTRAALLFMALALATTTGFAQGEPDAEEQEAPKPTTYALEGAAVLVTPPEGNPSSVALPCKGLSMLSHGARLHVACGDLGAVILSLSDPDAPRVTERRDMGGFVSGFFVVGDKVWAQIARVEARPLDHGLKATGPLIAEATLPEEPEEPEEPEPEGEVVETRTGEVVVSLGSAHGLGRGARVELFERTEEDLGEGESATREERLAVGVATAVSEGRSVIKLGLGERVPKGTLARPTERKLTNKRLTPPRVPGIIEVEFNLRPFLALGTFGFGMVSDGSVGYRTDNGLHLLALLEPIGLGFADEGNIVAMAASAVAAYDTQLFEVGLGLGLSAVNDSIEDNRGLGDLAEDGELDVEFDRVRSGLSIVQTIRLGALDGLHLKAHNAFLFFKDEFHYGGTNATFQIPVSERSWLILRGGGGIAGYGYGEIGLRVLLTGNGDHGSLFLTPRLGGAGLFGEIEDDSPADECFDGFIDNGRCVRDISYAGPMIGLGVEWRP